MREADAAGRRGRRAHGRGASAAPGVLAHDVAVCARRCLPLAAVALIMFVVAVPVSTCVFHDQSIFNVNYTHDQLKYRLYLADLHPVVFAGLVALGCAHGVRLMRFATIRSESTMNFSLPLTRLQLAGVRLACGTLSILVVLGVALGASLALNVYALGVTPGLFEQWAYVGAGMFLTALVAFIATCIAFSLAGTFAEGVMLAAGLLASVSVLALFVDLLFSQLLVGNPYGATLLQSSDVVSASIFTRAVPFNPVLFFYDEAMAHQSFSVQHPVYEPPACDWLLAAGWLAAAVVLAALALLLFVRRPAEIAGLANTNMAADVFVASVGGLLAFCAVAGAVCALDTALAFAAGVLACALASLYVLRRGLFRRGSAAGAGPAGPHPALAAPRTARLSQRARVLLAVGVQTACVAACVLVFANGALGFSQRVPAASEVQGVSVSYVGAPDTLGAKMDTATAAGTGPYYYSARYTLHDEQAIEVAVAAHGMLAQSGRLSLDSTMPVFGETAVPYDVVFDYTLKDGSRLMRYYDRASLEALDTLLGLDAAQQVRAIQHAVVSGKVDGVDEDTRSQLTSSLASQAFALGEVFVADRYYAHPQQLELSAAERSELLAALADDLASQDLSDRYRPAQACRGVIMFTQNGAADAGSFAYRMENSVIYLTPAFTRTLRWLSDNGAASALKADAAHIESLTFMRYDPHASVVSGMLPSSIVFKGYRDDSSASYVLTQDFGALHKTSERADIEAVAPALRNTYCVASGGYLVCAKLAGIGAYAYLFVAPDELPDAVAKAVG